MVTISGTKLPIHSNSLHVSSVGLLKMKQKWMVYKENNERTKEEEVNKDNFGIFIKVLGMKEILPM